LGSAFPFLTLFGPVPFTIADGPEGMACDKEGSEEFAVPGVFVKFSFGVTAVHVILLQVTPEGGKVTAE
jgi:hypothetical protein